MPECDIVPPGLRHVAGLEQQRRPLLSREIRHDTAHFSVGDQHIEASRRLRLELHLQPRDIGNAEHGKIAVGETQLCRRAIHDVHAELREQPQDAQRVP